ncbi:MAG: MFS transporter [Chloroflexota bacterium]
MNSKNLSRIALFIKYKTGFEAFTSREYRFFWLAAAFSNIGIWCLGYGRIWLMHEMTGSTKMVGLVGFFTLSPVLLLSVLGGVLADSRNRLINVRITRMLFSLLALVTAILLFYDLINPFLLLTISLCAGILLALDLPSRASMLPALVDKRLLPGAISLYSIVFGASAIIGPLIFAPLVKFAGIQGVFFIISSCYFLTYLSLLKMNANLHQPEKKQRNIRSELSDGLIYIFNNKSIRYLIILGVSVTIFFSSFDTLLPKYSEEWLSGGVESFSKILLGSGIGGLIATSFLIFYGTQVKHKIIIILSCIGIGIAFILFASSKNILIIFVAAAFVGGLKTLFNTMSTTLAQVLADNIFRGRVMSVHQLTWSSSAIGSLIVGFSAEFFGIRLTLVVCGAFIALMGFLVGRKLTTKRVENTR